MFLLALATLVQLVNAFTPIHHHHPSIKRVEQAREAVERNEYLKMVAGGAAAGKEEYYEGMYNFELFVVQYHSYLIFLTFDTFYS